MTTVISREEFLSEMNKLLPVDCNGVELGVLYGDFSKQILEIICPKKLVLVDPYETAGEQYSNGLTSAYSSNVDYENVLLRFRNEISREQVMVVKEYSYEAVKRYPDNFIDFIYIDASHLYQDVKRDLSDWLPKLKEDGFMCLHDYAHIEDFGVIKATDEFMNDKNFEMIIFNENGGDCALRRKQV